MGDYAFPFASSGGDRKYNAQALAQFMAMLLSNGVPPVGTHLQVTATSGMSVNVSGGSALINGYGRTFDTDEIFELSAADGVLNRIDRIVVRWGRLERNVFLDVIEGTPASTALAPAITRDADYYDLCIAEISIPAGITEITAAHISDKRLDPILCGVISSLITPDTDGWFDTFDAEFMAWFAHIKELLADDPATELAAAVATLESEMDTVQGDIDELENAATPITTGGAAPAFTVADSAVTAYYPGLRRTIVTHADSGANPTLKYNALSVVSVLQATGKATKWLAGQHVMVEHDGTNFFACSAGGGIELPAAIEAGDTLVYANIAWVTVSGASYVNFGGGHAVTILKAGIYRFKYGIEKIGEQTSYGRLTLNGVAVASSEVGTTGAIYKTIDVSCAAGDVIRLQGRNTNFNSARCPFFGCAILMAELSTEFVAIVQGA